MGEWNKPGVRKRLPGNLALVAHMQVKELAPRMGQTSGTQFLTPATERSAVNCWQCRHFATSWDPRLPYLCKLLGFKSRNLPAQEVFLADGRPCQGFAAKLAPLSELRR